MRGSQEELTQTDRLVCWRMTYVDALDSVDLATTPGTRQALIDAAIALVRERGLSATSVNDLCAHAGVSKGAFFHHFKSKDELVAAAALYWGARANVLFDQAGEGAGEALKIAAARVFAYLDSRTALMDGTLAGCSCFAGTSVQEAYAREDIRSACAAAIFGHAQSLEPDLAKALFDAGGDPAEAPSLATHIQAVIQGAFIVAKAAGDFTPAHDTMRHLRRYFAATLCYDEPQGDTL